MTQSPKTSEGEVHRTANRLPVPLLLCLAILFGSVAGLLEVGGLGMNRFLLGKTVSHSAHVIWMAPVANMLIFLVVGSALWLVTRMMTEDSGLRLSTFCFAFVMVLGLRFISPGIHTAAWMMLSAGIAVVITSSTFARRDQFVAFTRRAPRWCAVLLICLIALASGLEYRNPRPASETPLPENAPNVLLIVLDTVPAKSMGYHGYERPATPNIDAFAKRGVIFEHGISTAPWTLTSHASMFTGQYPAEMTTNWDTPLDESSATLAEIYRDRGYFTVGVVANMLYCYREWGLDRGFVSYDDYDVSVKRIMSSSYLLTKLAKEFGQRTKIRLLDERKSAAEINERFLAAISDETDRPFFAFLNYFDTHSPYEAPDDQHKFFSENAVVEPREGQSSAEHAEMKNAFDGCLRYLDQQIGSLLSELERQGRLDNTLVIITSDHGEQFGEHDLFLHGNSLYRPLIHVPLIVIFPGEVPADQRLAQVVTLRDLGSTILDLTRVDAEFPGHSWRPLWNEIDSEVGELSTPYASVRSHHRMRNPGPAAKGDIRSTFADNHQYILHGDDSEHLYDFVNDPLEETNLVDQERFGPLLERCRELLKSQPVLKQ